jgi:hypothetical protein
MELVHIDLLHIQELIEIDSIRRLQYADFPGVFIYRDVLVLHDRVSLV